MKNNRLPPWFSPAALLFYSLIPVAISAMRIAWFYSAPKEELKVTEFSHFAENPIPILTHIIAGSIYCILASLQFTPNMALNRPTLHRWSGRIAFTCGIIASVTGSVMILTYPANDLTNTATMIIRFVFGVIMTITLVLAYKAVRQRQFSLHRAWMIRSLAIGLGGATQLLLIIAVMLIAGKLTPPALTFAMGMGWIINLAFAEWRIHAGQTFTRQNKGAVTA